MLETETQINERQITMLIIVAENQSSIGGSSSPDMDDAIGPYWTETNWERFIGEIKEKLIALGAENRLPELDELTERKTTNGEIVKRKKSPKST